MVLPIRTRSELPKTMRNADEIDLTETAAIDADSSVDGSPKRDPTPGEVAASRYSLGEEVGRGGTGRVLRAHDKNLEREIAVKELLYPTATAEARFFREAKITARLQHPGIVPIYETGRWPNGEPFYAMKMVAGTSLKEHVGGTANLEQRLELIPNVLAVTDAVAYAHSRRIIHRDLKPSNIIIGEFGETIVIDWGLGRDLADKDSVSNDKGPFRSQASSNLTVAGTVIGTPAYMPPEQARGEPANEQSDVYALGALLYAVVTGQAPCRGTDSTEVILNAVAGARTPVLSLEANTSPDLVAIIDRAMAHEPSNRYRSATELSDELRRFLAGRRVAARSYSAVQIAGRWIAQHQALFAVAMLSLAAMTSLAVFGLSRLIEEKNRTARQYERAETALSKVDAERDRLLLLHARAALADDPTRALGWLKQYDGSDSKGAQELAARAVGLGVATTMLLSPSGGINRASIGSGGNSIVAATTSGSLREWRIGSVDRGSTEIAQLRNGLAYAVGSDGSLAFETTEGVVLKLQDGRERLLMSASEAPVRDIRFTVAGRAVVSSDTSGTIRHIDLVTSEVRTFAVGSEVPQIAVTDDGEVVFGCSSDGVLFAWLPATAKSIRGACRGEVVGASTNVGVALTDNGPAIFTGTEWSVLPTLAEPVAASISSSRGALAFLSADGSVSLAHLDRLPAIAWKVAGPTKPSVLTFAEDSIIVGSLDGEITVYALDSGAKQRVLRGHRGRVQSLEATQDGRIVSASVDGEIRVWKHRIISREIALVDDSIFRARMAPDGSTVAMDSRSGSVRMANGTERAHVVGRHGAAVFGIEWAPDSRNFATASWDGTARVWSRVGDLVSEFNDHEGVVRSIKFANPTTIITGGEDGRVYRWAMSGEQIDLLTRHGGAVRRIALSVNGDIATVAENGSLRLWEPHTARARELLIDSPGLAGVAFSPLGTKLAVTSDDGSVRVWNAPFVASSTLLKRNSAATALAFSSTALVVGWGDGLVTIITESGAIENLTHGDGPVLALAVGRNGNYLAASIRGGPIEVFHHPSQSRAVVFGHDDDVGGLEISATGDLISSSYDGRVLRSPLKNLEWAPSERLEPWLISKTDYVVSQTEQQTTVKGRQ